MRRTAMAVLLLLAGAGSAAAAEIQDFFGTYIGLAEYERADGSPETREMDITIAPEKEGFRIEWISTQLVDGRRDLPGVVRRPQSAMFTPGDLDGVFVQEEAYNPFKRRAAADPMAGQPLRWASIAGDSLRVNTFVIQPEGRYEVQFYDRTLTDTGLAIQFERIVDGEVVRRITGHAVRAVVDAE